jgi:flagellar basal body-associated protein FliL
MTPAKEIFCGQYKDFLGSESATLAHNFKDSQQGRWNTIFQWLVSQGGFPSQFQPGIVNYLLPANYTIVQIEKGHRCSSDNRPLINSIEQMNITPTLEFTERISIYIMLEYGKSLSPGFAMNFDPRLLRALKDYEQSENPSILIDKDIDPRLSRAMETANILEKRLSDFEKSIASADTTLRSKLQLKEPAQLWKNKSSSHGWIIIFIFIIVLLIFLIFGYLAISKWSVFNDNLPKTKDGELSIIAASLIALPVIATAWFARIFIRVLNMNIELREDARQRSSMIETYLSLLADPKSNFDEKDRALLLSAIFRPVNATQPDVNPPTIADLLKQS